MENVTLTKFARMVCVKGRDAKMTGIVVRVIVVSIFSVNQQVVLMPVIVHQTISV